MNLPDSKWGRALHDMHLQLSRPMCTREVWLHCIWHDFANISDRTRLEPIVQLAQAHPAQTVPYKYRKASLVIRLFLNCVVEGS